MASKKNLNRKFCIDQVFILLSFNNANIILGCIYFPPNSHFDLYNKHCELVENFVINNSTINILVIVDFNLNKFSVTDYTLFKNPISNILINCYDNYDNLKQINNVTKSHNGILDLYSPIILLILCNMHLFFL